MTAAEVRASARKGDSSVVANDVGICQINCSSDTEHKIKFNDEGLRCAELTRDDIIAAMADAPENGGREIFRL